MRRSSRRSAEDVNGSALGRRTQRRRGRRAPLTRAEAEGRARLGRRGARHGGGLQREPRRRRHEGPRRARRLGARPARSRGRPARRRRRRESPSCRSREAPTRTSSTTPSRRSPRRRGPHCRDDPRYRPGGAAGRARGRRPRDAIRTSAGGHRSVEVGCDRDGSERWSARLGVTLVVVGRPVALAGIEGPAMEKQKTFLVTLRAVAGRRRRRVRRATDHRGGGAGRCGAGGASAKKRKEIRDAVAAQVMLQGYLDSRGRSEP